LGGNDDAHQVERLRDLGALDPLPVGTRVRVHEDGILYIGIGNALPEVAAHIGWGQANVWMPEHVYRYSVAKRSSIFPEPALLASSVLTHPDSVHRDVRRNDAWYFITSGTVLRDRRVLTSESTSYVDAAIELRRVSGGSVLRLFHLSPRNRNYGGEKLWP
jgi:hypothetical protein